MAMTFATDVTLNAGKILKTNKVSLPTTAGGSTYGNGAANQSIRSNGTTIYWADDTDLIVNVPLNNVTISGSTTEWGSTTIDMSSYIPSGYTIYNVICCIKDGNSFLGIPWYAEGNVNQHTRIDTVLTTGFKIRNKGNWSANTNMHVTLFLHKTS